MPKANYSRFADGVQISGISLSVNQKGRVFYVCNSTTASPVGQVGSDGTDGLTPDRPLATLTKAIGKCVANRGDTIIVLPGHAETVTAASGINFNVAGITVVGVGTGSVRPTITLSTANTATVAVSANDVSLNNLLFVGNFLAIAVCLKLSIAAKDCQVIGCEFRDTSSVLGFVKAIATGATDNGNDGLTVRDCVMNGTGTTAATCFVNVLSAIDRMNVANNNVFVQGTTATTGVLVLATGKAMTTVNIAANNAQSLYTGSAGALIVGTSGSTGLVIDNTIMIAGGGTDLLCTASTGLSFQNNTLQGAADASGYVLPAIDS